MSAPSTSRRSFSRRLATISSSEKGLTSSIANDALLLPSYEDVGDCTFICEFCGALFWFEERVIYLSRLNLNNIAANQGIKDGIWFRKISTGIVVWVANREFPIPNKTGTLKINRKGHLSLSCCGDTLIWSSNSSVFVRYNNNPVAQLLDTRNFVVKDGSSSSSSSFNKTNFLWKSFDYPSDTLLAGMKLGMDFVTGIHGMASCLVVCLMRCQIQFTGLTLLSTRKKHIIYLSLRLQLFR
uniref:Bulb-type lectin domain-containing protein n=1 Tax=Lactuca sativa TaxID=4236 RepID=A0A9R1VCI2_LACSA|nr:hypothetical protein LSAT_V11C600340540 [Lactuca sativa]